MFLPVILLFVAHVLARVVPQFDKRQSLPLIPQYITLPLDHTSDASPTFQNRYFVNATLYTPGGPVIVFDSGEGQADPYVGAIVYDSFISELAHQFHGAMIVFEHRFYGGSLPNGLTLESGEDLYQYLTIEQALADVAALASNFSVKGIKSDLTSSATPWVFVGSSYSGLRAALLRERYPHAIYASMAGSAPVETKVDFYEYFKPIASNTPAKCRSVIEEVVNFVDAAFAGHNETLKAELKSEFSASNLSDFAFGESLQAPFQLFQNVGYASPFTDFCEYMTNQSQKSWNMSSDRRLTERWASWPQQASLSAELTQSNAIDTIEARSYLYQSCTELGYFQTRQPSVKLSIVSNLVDVQGFEDVCLEQFPFLPGLPATDATNAKYGGWSVQVSNTLFISGSEDPWRPLQVFEAVPTRAISQQIPPCNQADETIGYTISGGVHGEEVSKYRPGQSHHGVQIAQHLFASALAQWLPCFNSCTS